MDVTDPHASPDRLGPNDLVWDHMSRHPDDDPVERVRAAAAAGFAGIGLFVRHWRTLRDDPAHVERLEDALADTGLRIWGMEVAATWLPDGTTTDEMLAFESAAWDLADRFGCVYLQAIGRGVGGPEHAAPGFGALCDRAADHGIDVALEFVPGMTDIQSAADARELVERVDRPNAGYCVDSWHLTRSTNDPADILTLPGERIFCIQLNDGPVAPDEPDYYTDTISNRVAPGSGEFDLVQIVRNLDAIGASCPISLEVCSRTLWTAPMDEAARVVHDGMRSVLATARG